jgi:hypothetical protein
MWGDENDSKRTLGIRDKQILYNRANGRCENPVCKRKNRKIDFDEMQVGHKIAYSKGGKTTLKNSVCLCYRCNKLQGTDNWTTFLKKQGCVDTKIEQKKSLKISLESLIIKQLKYLADKHHIKIKGKVDDDGWNFTQKAPTNRQYINKLSGITTQKDIDSIPKEATTVTKKKVRKKSDDSW